MSIENTTTAVPGYDQELGIAAYEAHIRLLRQDNADLRAAADQLREENNAIQGRLRTANLRSEELEQRHQQDQEQITRLKALLFDYIRESGYTMDEVYA